MQLLTTSPDLVMAIIIGGVALYGMIGGAARLRSLVLATYVGIVLAQVHTSTLSGVAGSLGVDGVSLLLLMIPIIIFMIPRHKGHGEKGSIFINGVVGLAAGAFIIVAGLHVVLPSTAATIAPNSTLSTAVFPLYPWFVLAMPLVALIPHAIKHKGKDHKDK